MSGEYNTKIRIEQGGEKMKFDSDSEVDIQGAPRLATITVGTEAANVINVAIQLNDGYGNALAVRGSVMAYLSDDANGDDLTATAPDGGWAIGTDGVLIPLASDDGSAIVPNKTAQLVSESDGDIDIDITEAGAGTWYLILVLPDGRLQASGAITFA